MGTYNLSNLNNIDSLLLSGRKWGAGNTGTGATVTYNFSNQVDKTHNPLTNAQIQRVRSAFNAWSEIANVQFTESTNSSQITLFGVTSSGGQTRSSWNNTGIIHADMDLGPYNFASGTYSYGSVLLHEIGHALGLKHPHDKEKNGFDVVANQDIDTTLFSVMSYRSYVGQPDPGIVRQTFFPTTPMLNDIAAIQYIYGANWNTRNGNTIYKWNSGQQILETIWDGDGIDTIDWSNQSTNASINLNAGLWSQLGPGYTITRTDGTSFVENRTLAIAFGVTIENATGGTGDDTINGNEVSNMLQGGVGSDSVYGGNGNDFLGGWSGNDKLYGEAGNDTLYGDSGVDTLYGGDGNDLLFGHTNNQSVINTLGTDNNTDYLSGGAGNDTAYGGYGNDFLYGEAGIDTLYGENGDDYIDGGSGGDYMNGGNGSDTFVVDNLGDRVVEDPRLIDVRTGKIIGGAGTDTVQSSISYSLTNYVENLTLLGTANLNGTGNVVNNLVQGNTGNNIISGLGGNDTLYGGDGNDTLDGGIGNDFMHGGGGNDTYVVDSLDDQVAEYSLFDPITGRTTPAGGTDTVRSSIDYTLTNNVENLILVGNFNIDGIGNALNNLLQGNNGNNYLYGLAGNDTLSGGAGNDYLVGGEGDDSLIGGLDNDNLLGGDGNDTLSGGDGDDNLNGEAGNNIIDGGTGHDILVGSGSLNYTLTNTQLIGEGTDTFVNIEGVYLYGDSSNNTFDATGFTIADMLFYGGAGDDLISAGAQNDYLYGQEDADTLFGGAGNDYLVGGEGNDILNGDDGDDGLEGGAGDDILNGGAGNDYLAIYGDLNYTLTNTQLIGEGTDTLVSIERVYFYGGSGSSTFDATGFTTSNVVFYGGAGDDLLSGGAKDDLLYGQEDADTLFGGAGNDYLVGGQGNDILNGGDGDDELDGGAGDDILDGGAGSDHLAFYGDLDYTLTDTQLIGEGTDTLVSIERVFLYGGSGSSTFDATGFTTGNLFLFGGAGDDLISGGAKDDLLYGQEGADTLSGSAGNDYLVGGEGDDSLIGGLGNDQLVGDIGNDTLLGGQGIDNLEGDDGSDLFSFAAPSQGIDLIADFVSGVDKIGIDVAGFGGGLVAGLLSNSQFVLGTKALDGADRFIYDQSMGALFFDKDGTGATAQVQFATISNFSVLSASDILVA